MIVVGGYQSFKVLIAEISTNFLKIFPADNNDASHEILCGTKKLNKVFSTLTVVTSSLMIGANPASAKTSSISEQSLIKWSW